MKKGADRIDLTMDDINNLMDEYEKSANENFFPEPTPEALAETDTSMFDAFIERIATTQYIQYEQAINYSGEQEALPEHGALIAYLDSDTYFVTESSQDFVVTNPETTLRVLHSKDQTHLIDLKEEKSVDYTLTESDTFDFLHHMVLQNPYVVEISSEIINGTEYNVFHVDENDNLTKWYFNDEGNLFLRIYSDGAVSKAVSYMFLDFEPKIASDLFELSGSLKNLKDIESSKEESSEAERTPTSSKESSDQSSESSKKPSSLEVRPKEDPTKTEPDETPDGSSKEASEPKSEISVVEVKEPDEEQAKSLVPENYPHSQVPLMPEFHITSGSEDNKTTRRVITLSGDLYTSFFGATTYYTKVLKKGTGFTSKEMYDESSGYTYMLLRSNVDGWDTSIEIAESHATSKCSMSLIVKK